MTMKNYSQYLFGVLLLSVLTISCSPEEVQLDVSENSLNSELEKLINRQESDSMLVDFIQMNLEPESLSFRIPAVQSPVTASLDGKWVIFGGRKAGLHSMDFDPPAFQTFQANDSIWVIDLANAQSYGVMLPNQYFKYLSASSQLYFQEGSKLYVNGGFTFKDSTATFSNWTSDAFFEIDLPSLISYVMSGGGEPTLDAVVTKFIRDPFLKVTGGEMIVTNGNFYLVGGQNYDTVYSPSKEGIYTNAIRKFRLEQTNSTWTISDTLSLKDTQNLHRRDFNLAEILLPNNEDSLGAVIYGGVFTDKDLAYQNPVYISGLASGNPRVQVDTQMKQDVNLYSSAKINAILGTGSYRTNRTALLGGITYKALSTDSTALVIPPISKALPFSNLISSNYSDGENTIEIVQLPPNQLLSEYLGTNAVFFPKQEYLYGNSASIVDLNMVFQSSEKGPVLVGYLYGGILSTGPYAFAKGSNGTFANPVLYKVFFKLSE